MCDEGERPLCELPSDGSTTNKENMRSAICVPTSIHLVYVRIPGKEISYVNANGMMMIPMKRVVVMCG
jgi:hypothetical protein